MAATQSRSSVFGQNVRAWQQGPIRLANMTLTHINAVAADIDIVPSATFALSGPYSTDILDIDRIKSIVLGIAGTAKNTFAGANNTNGAQNIQANVNGGAYQTIASLPDLSLPCGQGATHSISIVSQDIKALLGITDITHPIGVKWALARAASDGFDITGTVMGWIQWEV